MSRQVSARVMLSAAVRLARVVWHCLSGMAMAMFFPLLAEEARRRVVRNWSRQLLEVLHIGLQTQGAFRPPSMRGGLLVANHLSWVDAIAMNAITPARFVAKSEAGYWPVLGWLCRRAGTLFVRHDVRQDAMRASREICALLRRGSSVALFPEDAASDGLLPGHFHSSLLQAAIDADSSIYPVAIRYHDGMGRSCGDAAFFGDMSFIRSLWRILCSPSLCVSLHYLPSVPCAGMGRRALAAEAHGAIHLALARFSPHHSVCIADAVRLCNLAGAAQAV